MVDKKPEKKPIVCPRCGVEVPVRDWSRHVEKHDRDEKYQKLKEKRMRK
jgi:uncharacterized C2H2 Zn-finger protein